MFRDAWLVTKKDLLIELRSRILINQIAPYTLLILVLFGFALDADTETLRDTGPGLFWVSSAGVMWRGPEKVLHGSP